ncbi:hypothetical protein FRC03_010138 [Tulasnella sp. 419]|nr:hypothetical protein FRC03_010138 [Tulasnella sp. 419]
MVESISWVDFEQAVVQMFDQVDRSGDALLKMQKLKQGEKKITAFTAEFNSIVRSIKGWNDTANRDAYWQKISREIRKELIHKREKLDTLAKLQSAALRIGKNLEEFDEEVKSEKKWEKKLTPNPPSSFFGKSENRPKEDKKPWDKSGPSTNKQIFPSKKSEEGSSKKKDEFAMDLDVLKAKKLQQYQQGRCFNCNKQGHISKNCPTKKGLKVAAVEEKQPKEKEKETMVVVEADADSEEESGN